MEKIEIIELLQNSFKNRWQSLGGQKESEIYPLIQKEFLIDEITASVNYKLNYSDNYLTSLRYQKRILRFLSGEFAIILFLISNGGKNINQEIIIESQRILKISSKCKIHPCTKLFG